MADTLFFIIVCITAMVICMWSVRIEREKLKERREEYNRKK